MATKKKAEETETETEVVETEEVTLEVHEAPKGSTFASRAKERAEYVAKVAEGDGK